MTNISKHILPITITSSLSQQLASLFVGADKKKVHVILNNFFTKAEHDMFMKRLAMVMLLERGYSKYRIAQTLHVSESTVKIFSLKHECGMFNDLLQVTRKKDFDKEAFWKTLEVIVRGGLPPRTKDKWKYVFPK